MARLSSLKLLALLAACPAVVQGAKSYAGRIADGTVGLGLTMYDPACAYMCRNSASGFMLDCPDDHHHHHGHHKEKRHGHHHMMPSPECYATNDPFLQTLAWCISTHCPEDVPLSKIENYWENNVAGNLNDQPSPKYSYQEALSRVETEPTEVANATVTLNDTSLVDEWLYQAHWGANVGIQKNMTTNNIYTLVVLLTTSLAPILFSLVRFLGLPASLTTRFYAIFIDPPVFGTKHATPAFIGLGIMPTRGQALFIAYLWLINIVLCAVDYSLLWPTLWYTEHRLLVIGSVANRTGIISFANLSLAVLFASRNNLLLWLTSWSRSTFVLLHRWLAVICVIQGVLHSILYFVLHGESGELSANAPLPYYYWGIIAMVFMIIIIPLSMLPVRQRVYEIFLASHVILVIFILVGCFLHIYFRYHWQWGYEIWTVLALALWGFDRFLARPLRLAIKGIKKAHVTIIDEDYLRIDIPGVEACGQAYLYFPTLTWRVWENHPFSVVPIPGRPDDDVPQEDASLHSSSDSKNAEKKTVATGVSQTSGVTPLLPGIAFFVRRRSGLTAKLAAKGVRDGGIPVLVEASYGPETSLITYPEARPSLDYPNVICIAGGVGITGVLPLLQRGLLSTSGTTKLFWGVRTQPLVKAVETFLHQNVATDSGSLDPLRLTKWGNVHVKTSVGSRFDLRELLKEEVLQGHRGGTTVVVCGPHEMSDEVRLAVVDLAKQGAAVRFKDERFGY